MLFNHCTELADFFTDLVKTVSSFSFQLKEDNSTILHPECNVHPYEGNIFYRRSYFCFNHYLFIVSVCYLTPSEQFYIYVYMDRTSYILR